MSDHIQIGDIAPRIHYLGDGETLTFTYPFPIFQDADIAVYVDGVKKILSTDYAVTDAGESAGGSVTFVSPPADGAAVALVRELTIKRLSDFQSSGEFRAKVINDELDFQTAALQQLEDEIERSIRLQAFDTAGSLKLPLKAARAGRVLAFDDDGNVAVSAEELTQIEGAATSAAAAASSASAAASSAASSAISAVQAGASATAAASSAVAAAAASAGALFSTILDYAAADGPVAIVADDDNGTMFIADMSDGNLSFELPAVAAAGDGERYGILRVGAANTLMLVRSGSDTVNGVDGDYTVSANDGELVVIVADTGPVSDNWIVVVWSQAVADETSLTKSGSTISIRDDGVTLAKLAGGTPGAVIGFDGSGDPAELSASGAPTGVVTAYAGSSVPAGWLACNGAAVSRVAYADLFVAIGTAYGVGDGSTTFNLPDIGGRVIAGKEASAIRLTSGGAGIDGATLGATGGAQMHQLTVSEMPSHSHSYTRPNAWDGAQDVNDEIVSGGGTGGSTGAAGGDAPHNNVQPTIVLHWIIKT